MKHKNTEIGKGRCWQCEKDFEPSELASVIVQKAGHPRLPRYVVALCHDCEKTLASRVDT